MVFFFHCSYELCVICFDVSFDDDEYDGDGDDDDDDGGNDDGNEGIAWRRPEAAGREPKYIGAACATTANCLYLGFFPCFRTLWDVTAGPPGDSAKPSCWKIMDYHAKSYKSLKIVQKRNI